MKQVIVLRSDLDMSEGKRIAQAAHASLGAYRNAPGPAQNRWETGGAKKVALTIDGEEALMDRFKRARAEDVPAYVVKDAGETELPDGTVTALGLGPAEDGRIDKITKDLSLI